MKIRKKMIQTVGAGALLALFAGGAQANLLTNVRVLSRSTHLAVTFSACTGWTHSDLFQRTDGTVTDQFHCRGAVFSPIDMIPVTVLKQFGTDAGAFQTVAVAAGTQYDLTAWAMNWVGDPMKQPRYSATDFLGWRQWSPEICSATFEQPLDPMR